MSFLENVVDDDRRIGAAHASAVATASLPQADGIASASARPHCVALSGDGP
jgi:hypothetical protein